MKKKGYQKSIGKAEEGYQKTVEGKAWKKKDISKQQKAKHGKGRILEIQRQGRGKILANCRSQSMEKEGYQQTVEVKAWKREDITVQA